MVPTAARAARARGCLEALVSGTALAGAARRLAQQAPDTRLGKALAAGREISGPLVTELAYDGDADALALLASLGEWLGVGLVNVVNIFNPDVVVIGGGLIAAGELILAPARRVLSERALALPAEHARVEAARFGAESGMLGAALLAHDRLRERARA
jgi:glucokinase